jgi:hypothetical protein
MSQRMYCYDDIFVISCRNQRRSKQSSESICCFRFGAIYIQVNVNTQYDFGAEYILKKVCRITEIRTVKESE